MKPRAGGGVVGGGRVGVEWRGGGDDYHHILSREDHVVQLRLDIRKTDVSAFSL